MGVCQITVNLSWIRHTLTAPVSVRKLQKSCFQKGFPLIRSVYSRCYHIGPGNQLKTVSRKQAVTTERQQKANRFTHANIDSTEFPYQEWSKMMHIGFFFSCCCQNSDTSETFTARLKLRDLNDKAQLASLELEFIRDRNMKAMDSKPDCCETTHGYESKPMIPLNRHICWVKMFLCCRMRLRLNFESLCCHHASVSQTLTCWWIIDWYGFSMGTDYTEKGHCLVRGSTNAEPLFLGQHACKALEYNDFHLNVYQMFVSCHAFICFCAVCHPLFIKDIKRHQFFSFFQLMYDVM